MKHGTRSYYVKYKCRCEECRKAERDYRRAYEAKKRKERGVSERKFGITHGTWSGYIHHGCRCEPCKDAACAYRNEWWARNRAKPKKIPAPLPPKESDNFRHGTLKMFSQKDCRCRSCVLAVIEMKRNSGL